MHCKIWTKFKEMEFMLTRIKCFKSQETEKKKKNTPQTNPPKTSKKTLQWKKTKKTSSWIIEKIENVFNLIQWYSWLSCCMTANLLRFLLSRNWNIYSIKRRPDDACWLHAFTFSTPQFQAELIVKVRNDGEVTTEMGCWSSLLQF